MVLTMDIKDNMDVWEVWDQKLNVLILHRIPDIYPLVTQGKYGLTTLVQLLEHLVTFLGPFYFLPTFPLFGSHDLLSPLLPN